jgi:catechol 2,3-dioxygenase-like lactoylglutathione lyase family enzyme
VPHVRVFALHPAWERTLPFYEKTLGLALLERDDAGRIAVFTLSPGVTLSLEGVDPSDAEHRVLAGRLLAVSFGVRDLAAAYRELSAAGVPFEGPPERQAWGGTLAFLRDPAGNVLTLVQPP